MLNPHLYKRMIQNHMCMKLKVINIHMVILTSNQNIIIILIKQIKRINYLNYSINIIKK